MCGISNVRNLFPAPSSLPLPPRYVLPCRTGPTYLISVPDGMLIGTPNSLAVTLLSNGPVRVTAEVKQADTSLVRAEETFTTGELDLA